METQLSPENCDIFDSEFYIYFSERMFPDSLVEKEIQFIINRLGITKQHRILDLPCGYGRYSNALAKKGYNVSGIDLNSDFIRKAQQDANIQNLSAKFMQGDMRSINCKSTFDHILTLNTSWGYFSHRENICVLENISKALSFGGYLCI